MTITFRLSGRFLSLLLCLFLTSSLFAQISKVNISGVITDYKTGEALPGANILLYRDSLKQSEIVRGEATNKYGFYSFPSIPTGEYYIFVCCFTS